MKKKMKQKLTIPFSGLKNGTHQFSFKIDKAFFEQFEYSIIENAEINIEIEFIKNPTMFDLHFTIEGQLFTECDRCLDPLTIAVKGEQDLLVKFGEDLNEQTDEILVLDDSAHQLDLSDQIYEYVHLLLPSKKTHQKKSECNQEMIQQIELLSIKPETEVNDPRWDVLNKLKNKED